MATVRHEENPFLDNHMIPIGNKSVRISKLGEDNNVLINQVTGEIHGTHVVAHRKVDSGRFVKVFADYMAFTFELTKAGNKALRVVMWALSKNSINKDVVILDKYTHSDFMEEHKEKLSVSYPTFSRGLAELEKAQILAKTVRPGQYYINPHCMFNGILKPR